jgi:hypothetical protein
MRDILSYVVKAISKTCDFDPWTYLKLLIFTPCYGYARLLVLSRP